MMQGAVRKTIRLLVPQKRGLVRRIDEVVASAGGTIEHTRIARPMRSVTVTEITVSCADASVMAGIIQSLVHLRSVTVVGVVDVVESGRG